MNISGHHLCILAWESGEEGFVLANGGVQLSGKQRNSLMDGKYGDGGKLRLWKCGGGLPEGGDAGAKF